MKRVMEMGGGDVCTTFQIYLKPLTYTFKNG